MSEAGAPDLPRWAKAALAALVAATLVVSCLPTLSWGLWQDETTMAWQAEAGWAIARDRLGDPAQSVLFGYIEALFYFPGPHMEAWLRAPAVIGTLASLFLVHRLAEMFVGKGSGLLALVPLAGSPLMLTYSTQARPYSLALAACLVTLWGVARWLDTRSWRHGLTFAVAFAVAVHLQFLFGMFAVVPAFLIWRHARRKQPIAWLQLAAWTGPVGAADAAAGHHAAASVALPGPVGGAAPDGRGSRRRAVAQRGAAVAVRLRVPAGAADASGGARSRG